MQIELKNDDQVDREILSVIAYEWDFSDKTGNELKIRKRLKRKKLGELPSQRLEMLRSLRHNVECEIKKFDRSEFWLGRHDERFAHIEDFDKERMAEHFKKDYPDVTDGIMEYFIAFSVFTYYLR